MSIDSDDISEAHDAADVLLLLRLVLNDGKISEPALTVLRRVGWRVFGIDALSMRRLEAIITAYNAESAGSGAEFRARPRQERLRLAAALLSIGRHDEDLKDKEHRLRARLAALLDLEEAELRVSS